ncbi:MAG: Gfo/Idh/MocA family protein [Acetivibrionales bacterium]|jgi:predicted dehydrogenase
MQKIKMAILGAGHIARCMADTIQRMDNVEGYAIASRDFSRAKALADEFSFAKAYGSYEDMLSDPAVELVYIATPHSHHAQHAIQCLTADKHVLCEKAFTVNAEQAQNVLEFAKKRNLFITEAIWPRYMPMAKKLREFCNSDKIGKIIALCGNLGYPVYNNSRINDPNLAGGALLDVGIYPLTFASIAFGDDITDITTTAVMSEHGVDMQNTITLTYRNGRTAALFSTVLSPTDRMGVIYGEKGYAIVDNINNYEGLRIYNAQHELIEHITRPPQITGYEYEVQAAIDSIYNGKYECMQMPHAQTIHMMKLMDSIRREWDMWYPCEQKK